ncbi:MAG: hypothetical protein R3F25_12185 [Gammaproteobacteria bacterium]|jgi:hypothetical protein|nr:hypothetical protein [Xanthomonadales bacterium]
MKTQANQILTVVGFFSLSILSTLGVCWGVTDLAYGSSKTEIQEKHILNIEVKTEDSIGIGKSIRLLIPKTLLKG